jgi:SAM-dependent methyltransferase
LSASATAAQTTNETAILPIWRTPQFLFGATILASACLLFLVQPLISKLILPWFGGSAAVWITCMVFFQAGLLGGYLYAYALTRFLDPHRQAVVHAVLILFSIAVLPILPNAGWQPKPGEDPTWKVLGALATSVGLPYMLLSSTSPLLQTWYAARNKGGLPYRYFALSNAGSMAALLFYPVGIEPFLKGHTQAWLWSSAYFLFALLCITTAAVASRTPAVADLFEQVVKEQISRPLVGLWVGLAACASALLLTVTNLLTQNIAPMPLLWVLPLSIYLLTFILCFERGLWYQRWVFLPLMPFALWWLASHTATIESADVKRVVPLICGSLFVCCMACHGELARLKPGVAHLTSFYLSLAAGGALGGVFVALIAPHVFSTLYEYPISYMACAVLLLGVFWREQHRHWHGGTIQKIWIGAAAGTVLLAIYGGHESWDETRYAVAKARNFYGALLVEDVDGAAHEVRQLSHGTIAHGVQIKDPRLSRVATTYYGRESGAGLTWRALETHGPIKLGVVGLGTGTMAAYGRAGDTIRFYDLNPLVVKIAHNNFTFLADSPSHTDVVLGDARLSLANEPSQHFDMLVIDAFAGDAIPVHLLTRQAFDIYWRHLKPDGVLAVHVSNQYLNLAPIVAMDAKSRSLPVWLVDNDQDDSVEVYAATYVLVSKRPGFFQLSPLKERIKGIEIPKGLQPWTDDFTSLWRILRLGA